MREGERAAFTLIELLVVVAVIAILAAMVMPVLTEAIDAGQRARCKSNLRQISAAYIAYIKDYSGLLPHHNDHEPEVLPPPSGAGMYWTQSHGRLLPFLRDPLVLRCTADAGPFAEPGLGRYFSYTSNTVVNRRNRNIGEAKNPSRTIPFLDGKEADGGTDGNNDRPYQAGGLNKAYGFRRHSDGFNALFLDGHVSWFKIGGTGPENYAW